MVDDGTCLGDGGDGEDPFEAILDANFPILSELLPPNAVTASPNL